MSKLLVLTIAIGESYKKLAELTHPTLKAYADKISADFYCISETAISKTTPHWEKFQIYYFLEKYDRIIYIDTDIIVRDDAPNLFDIVPETHLGMFNEGRFTNRGLDLMLDTCHAYKETLSDWDGRYFNSGVMVISKYHKSLFKKPEKEFMNFFEQSYLNMIIAKREIDMFELEHKFNRMTCMDGFTGEERHASYFIHYAGYPDFDRAYELVKRDLDKWKTDAPSYKYIRHIYISVTGGLGDQINAEPAIRWMRKNLYLNDEFIVATHFPRLFKHLEKLGVKVVEHGKADLKGDTPYYIVESLPGPRKIQWSIVSNLLCHTVDYCSISLMKRTLPVLDRTIRFEVEQSEVDSLTQKLGFDPIEYYVVHPGKHWNSKTLPTEYWQGVIDGLGSKVIVVGQTQQGDPPFYIEGARGTVDVDCSKVVDMRNKLSIGELAALLSRAHCLISNDSFPIHLAGAFNNKIVVIPTCKHPDHILPYRNGSVLTKTLAVYNRLFIDDVDSSPTQLYEVSADCDNINWNNYLLPVFDVINLIKTF